MGLLRPAPAAAVLPPFRLVQFLPAGALPWAQHEFGAVQLFDPRRTARVVALAAALAQQPTAALPEACGSAAALQAAYRLLDNAMVTPARLLAPHTAATVARIGDAPVVLAVNDTTLLDYTAQPATLAVGPLADARQQGLLLHGTLALLPDGTPLGLLALDVWHRAPATFAHLPDPHERPIADQESAKWLRSLAAAAAARVACPATTVVCVGDREADVYDLFAAARPAGVELLVRAAQNRRVQEDPGKLQATVAATPVLATETVAIPARPGQAARTATVVVRACAVTVRPPKRRRGQDLADVPLWAVAVDEVDAPAGVRPRRWLLLTTGCTTTAAEALERVAWYRCRWAIETWHKILQSGCSLAQRQLHAGARLERLLVLLAVVAWRILATQQLNRTAPEQPCTAVLSPLEWEALWCRVHQQPVPPPTPPTLGQAVRWLAQLGGFLGRPQDGEPGVTVRWRGYRHLADLTAMYAVMRQSPYALLC